MSKEFFSFEVSGEGMDSQLRPGDEVKVLRCRPADVRTGDLIVFMSGWRGGTKNAKRLAVHRLFCKIESRGKLRLYARSDSSWRLDSPIPVSSVLGRVAAIRRDGKDWREIGRRWERAAYLGLGFVAWARSLIKAPVKNTLRFFRRAASSYQRSLDRARRFIRRGRLDLARKAYAEAKKIDPQRADAYVQEGLAHLDFGENARAEEQFRSLIDRDAGNPLGHRCLALCFKNAGNFRAAERHSRKALELLSARDEAPLEEVLHATHDLADVLAQSPERLEEAERLFREALSRSEDSPAARALLLDSFAGLCSRRGERELAVELLKEAAALAADGGLPLFLRAGPRVHLAAMYADDGLAARAEGETDAAWSLYGAAWKIPETGFNAAVDVALSIGDLYRRIGAGKKAARVYRFVAARLGAMPSNVRFGRAAAALSELRAG